MGAWMESMAELVEFGHGGLNYSFSDVRALLPSARFCGTALLFAAFGLLCVWQDRWADSGHDRESGRDRE